MVNATLLIQIICKIKKKFSNIKKNEKIKLKMPLEDLNVSVLILISVYSALSA